MKILKFNSNGGIVMGKTLGELLNGEKQLTICIDGNWFTLVDDGDVVIVYDECCDEPYVMDYEETLD